MTAPGPHIFPVVRCSAEYFNKSKPRSAMQPITVDVHFLDLVREENDARVGTRRFARYTLDAPDWGRLATLLQ